MDNIDKFFELDSDVNFQNLISNLNRLNLNEKKNSEEFVNLGNIYQELNLSDMAIVNYEKALLLDCSNRDIYIKLFNLYFDKKLYYSAKRILTQFRKYFDIKALNTIFNEIDDLAPERKVTFYIPCYNVERYIELNINNILQQSYPIDEILIIDDGCTDNTIKLAEKFPVRIIKHETNRGLAAARNTAIKFARNEYLASLDTDAIADKYWLEHLMVGFENDKIAGTGGRLIEAHTIKAVDIWRSIRLKQAHDTFEELEGPFLYGCNTVYRKSILQEVGGYEEFLRTNFEDMRISNALCNNGYTMKYIPNAICRHQRKDDIYSCINTAFNWRNPGFFLSGNYNSVKGLLKKIEGDIDTCLGDTNKILEKTKFEVIYIDYISTFIYPFKTLDFYEKISGNNVNKAKKALYAYFVSLLNDAIFPNDLREIMLTNIRPYSGLNIEEFELIENIIGRTKASDENLTNLLIKIGCIDEFSVIVLKEVHVNISKVTNTNLSIIKMIEVSAKRINYEEKYNLYDAEKKVMLLNPPWKRNGRFGVRAGSRWPFTYIKNEQISYTPFPFFISYLASILNERGIKNTFIDAVAENLTNSEFFERISGFNPEIILMETATASSVSDSLWAFYIKLHFPKVKIIWVGTHVTALWKEVMENNPAVDFAICGEYDIAASELIQKIINNEEINNFKGIVYRSAGGEIINNGRTDNIEDINILPLPERLTLPIYKYNDLFAGMEFPSAQIHASRGCPYGCIYCIWPQVLYGNKKYRVRNVKAVMDEVEMLVKEYGFKSIYFDDDTFNIGKSRILEICDEFKTRNLNVPWGAMARADTSDFETLKAMKQSGMVGIKFGVESGDQDLVDAAEKSLNLTKVKQAVQWCKDLGLKVHLTFTFGLPGETNHTIDKTIQFAKECNPDSIQFSITTPFPGTKYFKMLKEADNILTYNWEMYDGAVHTVIKGDNLSKEELEEAVCKANREYGRFKMEEYYKISNCQ